MKWKVILVGGLVFYAVQFVVSMATGPIVHEGILEASYRANTQFWRPELNQDPPDMAALMPRWIASGLLSAFVLAAIYVKVRPAFGEVPWKAGLAYGFVLSVIMSLYNLGWSGVFNLPDTIWAVWSAESFVYNLPAGAVLGWLAAKLG